MYVFVMRIHLQGEHSEYWYAFREKKKKKKKIISIENNFFYLAEIQTLLKAFDKKI